MEDIKIHIIGRELYDESRDLFYKIDDVDLVLRHSLKSLSMWESEYKVSFMEKFGQPEMSTKAVIDYIAFMVVKPRNFLDYYEKHPEILTGILPRDITRIKDYIQDPMTATVFNDKAIKSMGATSSKKEIITAEIIYYWMTALSIPFECENWNLNKLLTLIRVCSIKNAPSKNMSKKDILSSNKSLNAVRRAKLGSKG